MANQSPSFLLQAAFVPMVLCLTGAASGQAPATRLADRAGEAVPTLEQALAAGRDLWGEAAMRRPDGPTYESFAPLLPPLRYVNAAFRHYPIALSAPGSRQKARFVGNGSAINARAGLPTWRDAGVPVRFEVGNSGEFFGKDLKALDGPRYAEGCLPLVQLTYRHAGIAYEQEVFASVDPEHAAHAALLVRFQVHSGQDGRIAACFDAENLVAGAGVLRDGKGQVLACFDSNWRWDAPERRLLATLPAGGSAVLAVFTVPLPSPPAETLTDDVYERQKQACIGQWRRLLGRGMQLEVSESVVQDAWRSCLIGSHLLVEGDVLCYSAGNQYERLYEAECGDAVRALLLYGFANDARRMIVPLLEYKQEGLGFHDAGFKLQLLAHFFWLTRDADFVRAQRTRWQPVVDAIVNGREAASGLLPPEHYCGDIGTNVYTLNSNANCWRGLRDMAAVLEELGERQQAAQLRDVASEFRAKILAAVEQSERRDVRPPFVPIALFGKEQPYQTITASQMGSYWNLMIPYVLGSGVFGDDSERVGWMLDYLHEHGGLCMGMTRFHQHSKLFANENGVDDLYGLRYVITLLRRDGVDRALVSFYGKLAHGLTRGTFLGGEGTGLVPLDEGGRPMYLPPNASGNSFFLWMLRYLMVQDWDLDDDGRPDTLRLLFATPRDWLRDGAVLRLEGAPTAFGPVSLHVQSRLAKGEVLVVITPPPVPPERTLLRVRLPQGWQLVSADSGTERLELTEGAIVDVSTFRKPFVVRFVCEHAQPGR